MKRFTDIAIKNLKPKDRAYEVPDPARGLGLRVVVWPEGKKSFIVRYRRPNGKSAKLTLGQVPLATARKLAGDAHYKLQQGIDPGEEKKAAKRKAADAAADTVRAICVEYMAHPKTKELRTYETRQRQLEQRIYPVLGSRPIASVTKTECIRLFDKIAIENGPVIADHMRAILGRIFTWHEGRHDTFRSPITRGMERHANAKERARKRTLNDDELRRIWQATGDNKPFSALVRFLLLTGARLEEAASISKAEVADNGDWLLPAERNKTKLPLLRPLSAQALAVIKDRPNIDRCDYYFTVSGHRPLSGFSGPKRRLQNDSGTFDWRLHDLRRTARSLMSRAGTISEIAERCLGHAVGGVQGTYDRYEYYKEKQLAFEKLATQLELIVNQLEGNVVPLTHETRASR
jgi:integrase